MNKLLAFFLTTFLLCLINSSTFAQKDNFLKEYLERWEHSRAYLIAVAEAMPDSSYNFKPTPVEMTFAEQLMHIALAMDWHAQTLIAGKKQHPKEYFSVNSKTKSEMINVVKKTFDEATEVIKDFDPINYEVKLNYIKLTRTKRQIFLLLADHVTHHRAQVLVYMRLKGVEPPKYITFQ